MAENKTHTVMISSFAGGAEGALHACRFDTTAGSLELVNTTTDIENPFFIVFTPDGRFLYSIHEEGKFGGNPTGQAKAFSFDPGTGALTFLNQQSTGGAGSCYLSVDATGRVLLVANYSGGSVSSLPICMDGRLEQAASFFQHEGSSVDPARQKGPHAHSIEISPDNKYAFAADLGLDKILMYQLNPATAQLQPNVPPFVRVLPGAGPRHIAFHASLPFAYVINEMANSVTVFRYEATLGALFELQTIDTLPPDFKETTHTADVKIPPNEKFLYGTNRGHDSIAVYAIDQATGQLSLVQIEPSLGKGPQNLAFSPDGHHLLVANMPGNSVVVFAVDQDSGRISPTGQTLELRMPSCIRFAP